MQGKNKVIVFQEQGFLHKAQSGNLNLGKGHGQLSPRDDITEQCSHEPLPISSGRRKSNLFLAQLGQQHGQSMTAMFLVKETAQ